MIERQEAKRLLTRKMLYQKRRRRRRRTFSVNAAAGVCATKIAIKCASCDEDLISDVNEDDIKNNYH